MSGYQFQNFGTSKSLKKELNCEISAHGFRNKNGLDSHDTTHLDAAEGRRAEGKEGGWEERREERRDVGKERGQGQGGCPLASSKL